jgi:signal transduction histidine kinase
MRRLPIRLRLTLPFALAMAVVLVGLGAFVYVRVASTLLAAVDQDLRGQTAELIARAGDEQRPLLDRDATNGPSLAELVGPEGRVERATPAGLGLLVDARVRRQVAAGQTVRLTVDAPRGVRDDDSRWRLLAVPAPGGGVLVAGRSLASREESLDRLGHELLLAAPAALILATLLGYLLAGAALRPVEAMRRQAEAIGASTAGRRLPVPPAQDELSRLARTLNDMLGRLEAALQHERRFVSDASHELRTPLALLRTELELALRRTRSRDELEAAVRSAAEETERLSKLAEDLLLIARYDQGSVPLRREPVSAHELLDGAARRFSARAGALGRTLAVEPEDATLDADPARVEQALDNLVDNALVHGGGDVTLFARPLADRVELHVADEGAGFPAGFAARAFERFSSADEARSRGGAGLGLAIVRSVAAAHGGTAEVGAQNGRGADVWIALPRRA